MTDQAERDDRMGAGYERWWAPVLAPSAVALLDWLDADVAGGATELLDLGVGTGNLARPALARWPTVRVTGVDASSEMVGTAEALVTAAGDGLRDRFTGRVAFAAEMPFAEGSFDAAMSSFVLQLVPSRPEALREVRRVLRPGGRFAYVTWMVDERSFAPDRIFDTLLDEFGFDEAPDDKGPRTGDVPSVERAAGELRSAGFRDATAARAVLDHAFTVDGYIAFLTQFDEETLFEEMGRSDRRKFLAEFRERLMRLDPDDLHFRAAIVYASGVRSG
jgi:ubiquinone/menaquinone biosynthesis C-methylase UbiE